MAFTGSPVIKQVSDSIVRITGLSLAGSASGTIGLHTQTGTPPDVILPVAFQPHVYAYGNPGSDVTLADSIQLSVDATATLAVPNQFETTKSGTTVADFRITLHNTSGTATSGLEMYVKFHT
jgi:hypothetical protein